MYVREESLCVCTCKCVNTATEEPHDPDRSKPQTLVLRPCIQTLSLELKHENLIAANTLQQKTSFAVQLRKPLTRNRKF